MAQRGNFTLLQTHIDPVPEFIIKQHLRYLNMGRKNLVKIISGISY